MAGFVIANAEKQSQNPKAPGFTPGVNLYVHFVIVRGNLKFVSPPILCCGLFNLLLLPSARILFYPYVTVRFLVAAYSNNCKSP
jgi:hypothetical protein